MRPEGWYGIFRIRATGIWEDPKAMDAEKLGTVPGERESGPL